MINMVDIIHSDYEKITDNIMWLNSNYILKFTVVLNKYSEKYEKQNYHKEIGYKKNGNTCININRDFDYFLSIESVKKNTHTNMRDSIMIRNTDIYFLCFKLNQVYEWFASKDSTSIFAKNSENRIFIPVKVNPIVLNLCGDKYIEFEPNVMEKDNGEQVIGVRIYLSNDSISFFMDINLFLSFKYLIENFNMYQSAQLMLNYLGRPDFGTNMYDITTGINTNNSPYVRKGVNGNNKTYLNKSNL